MAQSFADDPHSEDGSVCPRNFFGFTSYERLKEKEALYVPGRAFELTFRPVPGNFDTGHLQKIHWYLFRDIFPWAGKLRVVDIAKPGGASFAHYEFIASSLTALFAELKEERQLVGLDASAFANRAAYYLGEINAAHPFREGNGRTQREFIRTLALHAGHTLVWDTLQPDENTAASILSHTRRDNTGLARMIAAAIKESMRLQE